MRVDYECPKCGEVITASEKLEGNSADCPVCEKHVAEWPAPLEPDRRRRREAEYEESNLLCSLSWLLLIGGVIAAVAGIAMDTSVLDRDVGRVENLGLLARKQILILGGLLTVGLGILVKLLAVAGALSHFHRAR